LVIFGHQRGLKTQIGKKGHFRSVNHGVLEGFRPKMVILGLILGLLALVSEAATKRASILSIYFHKIKQSKKVGLPIL
jgi:hypothetical protein